MFQPGSNYEFGRFITCLMSCTLGTLIYEYCTNKQNSHTGWSRKRTYSDAVSAVTDPSMIVRLRNPVSSHADVIAGRETRRSVKNKKIGNENNDDDIILYCHGEDCRTSVYRFKGDFTIVKIMCSKRKLCATAVPGQCQTRCKRLPNRPGE
ncbi:unnamed protein product [Aphis gossypii]|uniref:Uncharacterized protein n=1 Tax=Aphis gossypii TaxID=80765 RepID=A0A9P0NH35_APHGO|nr:unnamed protein product [Aphis gossypii]